jgi:hypothetical protein
VLQPDDPSRDRRGGSDAPAGDSQRFESAGASSPKQGPHAGDRGQAGFAGGVAKGHGAFGEQSGGDVLEGVRVDRSGYACHTTMTIAIEAAGLRNARNACVTRLCLFPSGPDDLVPVAAAVLIAALLVLADWLRSIAFREAQAP